MRRKLAAGFRSPSLVFLPQEKFLHDRIKVAGKTGVLQDHITIERDGSNINVTAKIDFSKRYLKVRLSCSFPTSHYVPRVHST